jgi:glycosyltransferase involved in cell wall biosynthesis
MQTRFIPALCFLWLTFAGKSVQLQAVMTRLPISVCMISGAEAHRVGNALASVADWTSEIVLVLNAEVSDGTDEMAASFGAKVYREPWCGFVAQKNSAMDKANQPWLLGLDADEVVSASLRQEIMELFAPTPAGGAYSFPRRSFYLGRWIGHGDWYPDRCVRLWAKGSARWGGVDPHAELLVEGPVVKLRRDLLHYSNSDISSYVRKINYFADLHLQRQIAEKARWSAVGAIFRAAWRFVRAYFFRLGFLDGYPGFFIAASTAYSTLVRHSRLFEHSQPSQPPCAPSPSR